MSSQVTGMKYSLVSKTHSLKKSNLHISNLVRSGLLVSQFIIKFSQFWQHRRSCEWRRRPRRIQWCRSAARMRAPWCQCSQSTREWEWTLWFPVWWQSRRQSRQTRKQQIHPRRWNYATTIGNPGKIQTKMGLIFITFQFKLQWTYLSTKLEIHHHNRDLRTRHDKDQIHKEQESKEVVELVFPNGSEDEEQLYEHGSKGQNASHQRATN